MPPVVAFSRQHIIPADVYLAFNDDMAERTPIVQALDLVSKLLPHMIQDVPIVLECWDPHMFACMDGAIRHGMQHWTRPVMPSDDGVYLTNYSDVPSVPLGQLLRLSRCAMQDGLLLWGGFCRRLQ